MTALVVGGRKFAAGLDWLDRKSVAETAREARKGGSAWCSHHGRQTGYANRSEDHEAGMPALAAALSAWIDDETWMALVGADDGRCALVQVRNGRILATGDRVFPGAEQAWARIEEEGGSDWTLYATPDTAEGAEMLEAGKLPAEGLLRPAPLSGVTGKRLEGVVRLLSFAGIGLAGWGYRDSLVNLIRGAPEETRIAAEEEPTIAAAIDSSALVAGCREAIRRHTPGIPGWELRNLSCTARFEDSKLVAVRPALRGRPVLVARWAMRGNGEAALLRRVAERHLSEWRASRPEGELEGSVIGREAWVAVALPPVTVEAAPARPPSRLALRASLDRRFGLRAWRLEHGRDGGETRIVMRGPLSEIGALVEGVRGFEVLRLARGNGGWVIEGRRSDPVAMTLARFAELRSWLQ